LVAVGDFPDSRYFSITVNDMHYTAAQHLADADIDPVNTDKNPFVPGNTGSSPPYTGNQAYLVPISLGITPGPAANPSCAVGSFEGENLLDATVRHLSIDWNTNLQGPSVLTGLTPHVIDTPAHTVPNTAGSIIVRSYLAPEQCQGTPGTCSFSPPAPQPYLILRDATTGCAYNMVANDNLLSKILVNKAYGLNCAQTSPPAGCNAILSSSDPSAAGVSNWLDVNQKTQHTNFANITPQACYADGDPTLSSPPPFANRIAWARVAQWEGSPGPDDSYLGGAVSTNDLTAIRSGSSCGQAGGGCLMRFRFRLPDMPATPCQPVGGTAPCSLASSAQLRYSSLTFWYQTAAPGVDATANPAAAPDVGNSPVSIVSLADTAFARSTDGDFVTLLVNNGAPLPAWLQQTADEAQCATPPSGVCGVTQGIQPVTNKNSSYAAWTVNGYTVLDLGQFADYDPKFALLLTIRNTLPSAAFACAATAVPFSTAEYTNITPAGGSPTGSGLMGPYAPLVDYVNPITLPKTAPGQFTLPSESYCGILPQTSPSFNSPTIGNPLDWPNQFWPSNTTNPFPNLNCSTSAPGAASAQIYFVATQFPTPALTKFPTPPASQTACIVDPGFCNQIVLQSPQTSESPAWQPPLPVSIVGTGFGNLPQALPLALTRSNYLEVSNDGASGLHPAWDTTAGADCQIYIANWTNTGISLAANLPLNVTDMYQQQNDIGAVLSPLSDFSPLTFAAAAPSSSTGCPIAYDSKSGGGDNLTFTVTNPQDPTATPSKISVPVSPAGTPLF
jgi:hypothetical protein